MVVQQCIHPLSVHVNDVYADAKFTMGQSILNRAIRF